MFRGSLPQLILSLFVNGPHETMFSSESDSENEFMSSAVKWWILGSSSNRMHSAHPVNQRRQKLGEYHQFFQELKKDEDKFHSYMRMSTETFTYILNKIKSKLDVLEYKNFHTNPILAKERLVLTLR